MSEVSKYIVRGTGDLLHRRDIIEGYEVMSNPGDETLWLILIPTTFIDRTIIDLCHTVIQYLRHSVPLTVVYGFPIERNTMFGGIPIEIVDIIDDSPAINTKYIFDTIPDIDVLCEVYNDINTRAYTNNDIFITFEDILRSKQRGWRPLTFNVRLDPIVYTQTISTRVLTEYTDFGIQGIRTIIHDGKVRMILPDVITPATIDYLSEVIYNVKFRGPIGYYDPMIIRTNAVGISVLGTVELQNYTFFSIVNHIPNVVQSLFKYTT